MDDIDARFIEYGERARYDAFRSNALQRKEQYPEMELTERYLTTYVLPGMSE